MQAIVEAEEEVDTATEMLQAGRGPTQAGKAGPWTSGGDRRGPRDDRQGDRMIPPRSSHNLHRLGPFSRDGESILAMGTISLPMALLMIGCPLQADARMRLHEFMVGAAEGNPVGTDAAAQAVEFTLPSYGRGGVRGSSPPGGRSSPDPIEWVGEGQIRAVPATSTKARVRWSRVWCGRSGVKTKAGNVADAILLGRFAAAVPDIDRREAEDGR